MRLVPEHFSIRSKTATVNIRVSQQPHVVPKWQLQYSKGPDAHRTFATYPAKIKAETISTSESHLDSRYRSPGLVYSPCLSTAPLEAYLWHLVAGERIGAFQISSQCLAPWHLSIEFLDFIQRAIHESRSAINYRLEGRQWYTLSVHTDLSLVKKPKCEFRCTVSFRIDNGVIFDRTRVVPWVCPPKMELRPALSEIRGKDAGRDFILMNGVLEEGGV